MLIVDEAISSFEIKGDYFMTSTTPFQLPYENEVPKNVASHDTDNFDQKSKFKNRTFPES
jgi:hypothetical protein